MQPSQIPLQPSFVQTFAHEWIAAWNSRDLDRILVHYAPDVVLTSPVAQRILHGDGNVRGIEASATDAPPKPCFSTRKAKSPASGPTTASSPHYRSARNDPTRQTAADDDPGAYTSAPPTPSASTFQRKGADAPCSSPLPP